MDKVQLVVDQEVDIPIDARSSVPSGSRLERVVDLYRNGVRTPVESDKWGDVVFERVVAVGVSSDHPAVDPGFAVHVDSVKAEGHSFALIFTAEAETFSVPGSAARHIPSLRAAWIALVVASFDRPVVRDIKRPP